MQYLPLVVQVVSFLILVIGIFYRIGKVEERMSEKINQLEKANSEQGAALRTILDRLEAHSSNPNIHVNQESDRRFYEERRQWQLRIEGKLDGVVADLIKKIGG